MEKGNQDDANQRNDVASIQWAENIANLMRTAPLRPLSAAKNRRHRFSWMGVGAAAISRASALIDSVPVAAQATKGPLGEPAPQRRCD